MPRVRDRLAQAKKKGCSLQPFFVLPRQDYLLWLTMYSIAAFRSSSEQSMQVPFGGMAF